MIKVTIRLDEIVEDTKDRLGKFLDKYEKYLVYYEVSDIVKKSHYQGVVYVSDSKAYVALKTRFSTTFKDWPKGTKSMALVKKDTYEVYITKDGQQVFNRGFTEEDISQLQQQSYKKESKKERKTFYQLIVDSYDKWLIEERKRPGQKSDWTPSRGQIAIWLCDEFATFEKLWDVGILVKYTNVLEWRRCPSTMRRTIASQVENRY